MAIPVNAELNPLDLKDTYQIFKPQFEYFSPVIGASAIRSNLLQNIRFAPFLYGPDKGNPECMNKPDYVRDHFRVHNDCPQDKVAELVQKLFPSYDHSLLRFNQYQDQGIINHLTPNLIGKILNKISQFPPITSENKDKLTTDLISEIFPIGYKQHWTSLHATNSKKIRQLEGKQRGCSSGEFDTLRAQIAKLQDEIDVILPKLPDPQASPVTKSSPVSQDSELSKTSYSEVESFCKLIVDALSNAQSLSKTPYTIHRTEPLPPKTFNYQYPPHIVETALLGFFWVKGQPKTGEEKGGRHEIFDLLKAMPDVLKPEKRIKGEVAEKDAFLKHRYEYSNFDETHHPVFRTASTPLTPGEVKILLDDPEMLAVTTMIGMRLQNGETLHTVPYGYSAHSKLKTLYADCGETALRNFVNLLAYDSKKKVFDPEKLEKLVGFSINPKLIAFYKEHNDPDEMTSKQARDDWSENIVSGLSDVRYQKPEPNPSASPVVTSVADIAAGSEGGFRNLMLALMQLVSPEEGYDTVKGMDNYHFLEVIYKLLDAATSEEVKADPMSGRSMSIIFGKRDILQSPHVLINGRRGVSYYEKGRFLKANDVIEEKSATVREYINKMTNINDFEITITPPKAYQGFRWEFKENHFNFLPLTQPLPCNFQMMIEMLLSLDRYKDMNSYAMIVKSWENIEETDLKDLSRFTAKNPLFPSSDEVAPGRATH